MSKKKGSMYHVINLVTGEILFESDNEQECFDYAAFLKQKFNADYLGVF